MAYKLKDNLNSRYFEAANSLTSKKARRRIVAYVESYDDIYFWRTVLSEFENEKRYFEVMLPSKANLTRGKKSVLMNFLEGEPLDSPYVFHTYVYAIENFQCYAPSLHNVCVSVTLNDHRIFDFREYFRLFSEALFPLFVWSIMLYRNGNYPRFSITDLNRIADPGGFNVQNPGPSIDNVRRKVRTKVHDLQRQFPDSKEEYLATKEDIKTLGVTPQTTYLYIQGHHLFDTVVSPILSKVCNLLRQERQNEIYHASAHKTQKRNEMSCYENSLQDIKVMLKKNTGYMISEQFQHVQADIRHYLDQDQSIQ